MIVIPMLGKSSRFFDAGYSKPKYQLPLGTETVFAKAIRSFESLFTTRPFVFLVRADHDAKSFVSKEVSKLGISDFRIIEFKNETRGQAESVALGTADYNENLPIVIFNVDTIRHGFSWPAPEQFGDGFLEVFQGEGDGWSFVEPGNPGQVLRTTEKERISDLCSNGMYGFASLKIFRDAFHDYVSKGKSDKGELYIAPLYNSVISNGKNVKYLLLDPEVTEHCGVPADYELMVEKQRLVAFGGSLDI